MKANFKTQVSLNQEFKILAVDCAKTSLKKLVLYNKFNIWYTDSGKYRL